MSGDEFIKKVDALLQERMGSIIAKSVLKSNLARLKKDAGSLSPEDCRVLVDNIVKATALFETKGESNLVRSDLDALLKELS